MPKNSKNKDVDCDVCGAVVELHLDKANTHYEAECNGCGKQIKEKI